MDASDLEYASLSKLIAKYEEKGRGESASFLNWFLVNIYRLDETAADDAICDQHQDKGIDGIYVDNNSEEIHFFQSKIVQTQKTIGDVALKEFAGSLEQFRTPELIEQMLDGNANAELKKLINRNNLKSLVAQGYQLRGIFVTNADEDDNTKQYLVATDHIEVFHPAKIAANYIEFDADEGVKGDFVFDTSYAGLIKMVVDDATDIYLLPVSALELVKMEGIADGKLFSQNVRYSLGNTPVNKAIAKSIGDNSEHKRFPLYHNGITVICKQANYDADADKLWIADFVVVNGAQSISTFYHNSQKLTPDLRVFAKIVALDDQPLSRRITVNSNNQNAIKPRDLRSNHDIMLRLKQEFQENNLDYEFEIKRGQQVAENKTVISNEEAGRLLMAFDIKEPYSCHQIYRVFDEKYAQIFGRKEVTAVRIVFLFQLMAEIMASMEAITNKPMSKYTLTRFVLLDVLAHIIRMYSEGRQFLADDNLIGDKDKKAEILATCRNIMAGVIVDLNYEVNQLGDSFDYKKEFKSPESIKEWRQVLLKSYQKDVARDKAPGFGEMA